MPTIKILTAAFASSLLLTAACSKGESLNPTPAPTPAAEPPKPAEPAPVATETAADVFKNRCTPCHGANGLGDGPAAAALNPKPRNYTDAAWQKSVTDDQLKKTILYGGAAVGKSAVMPSQPDLESKPVVLDGLIKIIRDFGAAK
jgi:mono/diheme cytochrome c family protein